MHTDLDWWRAVRDLLLSPLPPGDTLAIEATEYLRSLR